MMHYVMTILLFIIVFGVVVISHEFGHFIIARMNGIHVVEFMIGMGPKLISWGKKDTIYSIRLLPIGGACMFEGEDGLNEKEGDAKDSPGAFPNANVWARIATVAAGPFFNFILALLVAVIMVPMIQLHDAVVSEIVEGGAALHGTGLHGALGAVQLRKNRDSKSRKDRFMEQFMRKTRAFPILSVDNCKKRK